MKILGIDDLLPSNIFDVPSKAVRQFFSSHTTKRATTHAAAVATVFGISAAGHSADCRVNVFREQWALTPNGVISSTTAPVEQKQDTLTKAIQRIRALKPGWQEEGQGERFESAALGRAEIALRRFLELTRVPTPRIVPSVAQGLSLEWRQGSKSLSVAVSLDELLSSTARLVDVSVRQFKRSENLPLMSEAIRAFVVDAMVS